VAVPLKAPGVESSASHPVPRPPGSISVSSLAFDGPSPSSMFRRADERVKIRELMKNLSRADQQLLEMVVERGLSHEEIAAELSEVLKKKVTAETIRQRYHRAQERLKKLAEEAGYR
jgi:DNA-directed RNA polymerase specialized sigma24 family protein